MEDWAASTRVTCSRTCMTSLEPGVDPTRPTMASRSPAFTEHDTLLMMFSLATRFHLAVTSYTVKPQA
ncbi:hypothetical protein E2C01_065024 [Portunus trituberculatus]|uniref:Uncharacterized protein n=1 Tax=Portunus trituberculatus TaxID=210409 RepID=A0A5B7HNI0_PORTR|nr:hypothetical protein [Portunus trituberculatus]